MPPKRPAPNVFGDDDLAKSSPSAPKRPKTSEKPSFLSPGNVSATTASPSGGTSSPAPANIQAQIEAARAQIAAKLSALKGAGASGSASPMPRMGTPGGTASPAPAPAGPAAPGAGASGAGLNLSDIQKQIAEAKRKIAAGLEQKKVQDNPYLSANRGSQPAADSSKAPGGIHPLLMGDATSVQERLRSMGPKFSTLKANARPSPSSSRSTPFGASTPKANPYLADSAQAAPEGAAEDQLPGAAPKNRSMHRAFQFNKPGRHMQAAEEMRREAQMEDLKRRIQESARKAGMQEELTGEEKVIKRAPPPEVEWWDIALLPNKSYDAVDDAPVLSSHKGKGKEGGPLLSGQGSPIDHYVQHPIPIPAPMDKNQVAPKGVILTKKEMKKMRRQRRQAELQDKQDRVKMGLLPPDPPKVKLSNLMRVLTSEAVADPTKVEARVRREVAARRENHEKVNAERKLTDEERRAKAAAKIEAEEKKGVHCAVFKIKHLSNPSHKFKVRRNAEQNGLTGMTIFNPSFALVLVEGPQKSIKAYKRLMLVRVDWTDEGRARDPDEGDQLDGAGGGAGTPGPTSSTSATGASAMAQPETDESGAPISLIDNTCELIWEGPLRERLYPRGFRARNAPTDALAREALGPKMAGYWDVAKRWTGVEEV